MHSTFKAFSNEKTFYLLRKILGDFLEKDQENVNMNAINKILAAVPLRLFSSQSDASDLLTEYFKVASEPAEINSIA